MVTRALAQRLPETVAITASDLNQPMLEVGASRGTSRPVHWRQADAMDLPFDDDSFDAVMCQFGAMFLPERPRAFAEAHRVLRHGGRFVFSVWDRIENNEFARVVADAVGTVFPDDPPTFLTRVPYAYHDAELIRVDLAAGGFATSTSVEPLEIRSRAASCSIPAVGFCQGSAWASTGRAGHALRREHPQAKWSIRTLADTTRRRGPSLRDRGSALRGGAPGRHRRPEPGNRIEIVYDPAEPSHARPVRGRPNLIRHGPLLSDSPDARRFSFRQKCVSGSAVETHPWRKSREIHVAHRLALPRRRGGRHRRDQDLLPCPCQPRIGTGANMNTGPTIQTDSTGDDVRRLQRILVMMKSFGPEGIDGIFGPKTEEAVRGFQESATITVDGIVGPETWGALPADPDTPELATGATGTQVSAMQQALHTYSGGNPPGDPGPIDGIFGDLTRAAVEAYQSDVGVAVDGIVGDQTWWAPAGAAGATLASLAGLTTV